MARGILHRCARLLETIAASPGGLSLTEIVRQTGLPPGTIHRLTTGLLDTGFIEPSDGRKFFVPGTRLLSMLHLGTPAQVLGRLVNPALRELVEQINETAFLAALIDAKARSIAVAVPSGEAQSYVQPGWVMPGHAAASAKAIYAFQEAAAVDKALARPLIKFTEHAHMDKAGIRAELEQLRADGFAVCREVLNPGIYSSACPIQSEGPGEIYSPGLVGPAERLRRFTEAEIVPDLRRASSNISLLVCSR